MRGWAHGDVLLVACLEASIFWEFARASLDETLRGSPQIEMTVPADLFRLSRVAPISRFPRGVEIGDLLSVLVMSRPPASTRPISAEAGSETLAGRFAGLGPEAPEDPAPVAPVSDEIH
jgi:hypothetical protein